MSILVNKIFIFDEAEGIQKLFEKCHFKQLQDKFLMILILVISHLGNMVKMNRNAIIFGQRKNGLESINLIDGDIVVKRPLYAHFQKRMIKCPEFKLVDSFYVIPNQLVIGEKISKQELVEVTRNKFYWEYIRSTMLKKLKRKMDTRIYSS